MLFKSNNKGQKAPMNSTTTVCDLFLTVEIPAVLDGILSQRVDRHIASVRFQQGVKIYVCVCIYMYIHTHTRAGTSTHARAHTHTHVQVKCKKKVGR